MIDGIGMLPHGGDKYMNKFLFATTLGLLGFSTSYACTNITLIAKNGDVVVGRTLEFGPSLNSQILTSPEGKKFQSPAPNGSKGMSWTSKYGYVFLDYFGVKAPVDGMNEKGLSVGELYLPGYTEYQKVPKNKENRAMAYIYIADYILGNFSNVEQVKKAVKNIYVYGFPLSVGGFKNMIFPLHLIVTDKSGKSITIEWTKGKVHVFNNPTGVLTNSPTYPWQLNNLKNYANMSPFAPVSRVIDGINYSSTGQGAGSVGIPGDYSPPSRFVKMNFLSQYATQPKNAADAVNLAQHIIDNVDIPNGIVRGAMGQKGTVPDTTQWTVFKDLKHHILYFKSYSNTSVKKIDLNKVDFSKGAPVLSMPVTSPQTYTNVTQQFIKSAKK
jgi:choloylglycine hydrolase